MLLYYLWFDCSDRARLWVAQFTIAYLDSGRVRLYCLHQKTVKLAFVWRVSSTVMGLKLLVDCFERCCWVRWIRRKKPKVDCCFLIKERPYLSCSRLKLRGFLLDVIYEAVGYGFWSILVAKSNYFWLMQENCECRAMRYVTISVVIIFHWTD